MAKISRKVGINWIISIFYNPCDSLPWIYLEIAFPAIIFAIWEYIFPGWKDAIQYSTGKSWLKHGKQNISAAAVEEATYSGKGLRFLFEAAEELDKRAWQFMVFEVAFDAYILWHSVLKSIGPCDPDLDRISGSSKLPVDGRPTNYDWQIGPTYITQQGDLRPYLGGYITVDANHWCAWTEIDIYKNFISGEKLRVRDRWRVVETGQILASYEPPLDISNDKEANFTHIMYNNPTGSAQTIIHEIQLIEGQFPLVWYCSNGFCSETIGRRGTGKRLGVLYEDVPTLKGVRPRHSLQYGKYYKRKKQDQTDINDT